MKERVGKFTKIIDELRENAKKILVIGFVSFGVVSLLAFIRGIGYDATVEITYSQLAVKNHPCMGYLCAGNLSYSLNAFLYPISHLSGIKSTEEFVYRSEPYDEKGESVKDYAQLGMLFREYPKNIPYYLTISFTVALGLSKSIERVRTRFRKTGAQPRLT